MVKDIGGMFVSISIKESSNINELDRVVICPVELDLTYQVLDPSEKDLVKQAAECLAETFAGIEIDGKKISEPMVMVSQLPKEDMFQFVLGYLENVVHQGLCLVAREKDTGHVVGVLACEDFNPDEEAPVFEGKLEPINHIIQLLGDIDERFINTVQNRTSKRVQKGEYIHAFMAGARLATLKRFVIIKLFEMLIDIGIARGYKGIVGEATNPRSEKMCLEYCGFHLVKDTFDNPIQANYCEYEKFKDIPSEVAVACKVVFRPLHPLFDI